MIVEPNVRHNTLPGIEPCPISPTRRHGFALPMVILVIAFLTITIAATVAATSSEVTTNLAQRGESRAFMLAQAGLENFSARRNEPGFCSFCGAPPATVRETTVVTLPGGYAQVYADRLRAGSATIPAVYLLRSRGVDTSRTGITGSSRNTNGERTVAQLVYWNVNQVNVLAGWTSTSGLNKQGSAGTISGVDNCGQKGIVAGIAVPNGDYSNTGNFTPEGNPPIQQLGSQADANASVRIDWPGIVNGNRIQPDLVITPPTPFTWPSFSDPNYYPVIRVNGDFTLPASGGRGTLIVTGNLTINGSDLWKGIMLVGGVLTSDGNNSVYGATMSGLNTLLGQNVGPAVANGNKTYVYDSCQVSKAAQGLASYSVFPNAWMDNFVTY
jgi:hypothetical protein